MSCDAFLKQTHGMFCWNRKGLVKFGESISWSQQIVGAQLHCWLGNTSLVSVSLLIFTLLREARQRASPGFLSGSGCSHWLMPIPLRSCCCCCIVPPLLLLNWPVNIFTSLNYTADALTTKTETTPKELLRNRSPSLCSITHFPLTFGQWAKGRMLKYLRTLIKLGFGKSKPTAGSTPMAKQSEPEKWTYISSALAQFHAWFTADFKKHLNHGSRGSNMKNPSHYKNTGIPHGFILSLIPLNQPVVTEKNSCLLSSFTTSFFYRTEGNWPQPRQLQNLDEDASETNITCVKEG